MKKFILSFVLIASLVMAAPSMACWYCGGGEGDTYNDNRNYDNRTFNKGGEGGDAKAEIGDIKNENKNTNINTTINTNKTEQDQKQGQAQGQLQGQAQKNELTIIEAETKREHISGSAEYAEVGSYTDTYKGGAEFVPVALLTAIKTNFSYSGALEHLSEKKGFKRVLSTGHSYNGEHPDDPSESIDVFSLDRARGDLIREFEVIGFLTLQSVKKYTDSFMVLQKAVYDAAVMQGNAIVVTTEDFNSVPKSKGWGIGTFFTGGNVRDNGRTGNASTGGGGTGWSTTKSQLLTMPWMTVQVIKYTD